MAPEASKMSPRVITEAPKMSPRVPPNDRKTTQRRPTKTCDDYNANDYCDLERKFSPTSMARTAGMPIGEVVRMSRSVDWSCGSRDINGMATPSRVTHDRVRKNGAARISIWTR